MRRDHQNSPSKGVMRHIPIMYAARDFGDDVTSEIMAFFKCGAAKISIEIFGLN
eukprot:NODE_19004_length_210_cov_0.916129.p1 GENE.NODE_19004_length_210_cov_0.916129~~NODE_19004_length_210_cov_0.916129.p1  ORF type:complete len:54 (-),score=7.36 NODE_19004_length_210_cov_0.916129:29-190(-)